MLQKVRKKEVLINKKLKDLLARNSLEYNPADPAVNSFFASLQNYIFYSVVQLTATEIIFNRCNRTFANVGLKTFKGKKGPTLSDVKIAKNYLTKLELQGVERINALILSSCKWDSKYSLKNNLHSWLISVIDTIKFKKRPIWDKKHKINRTVAENHAERELKAWQMAQRGGL